MNGSVQRVVSFGDIERLRTLPARVSAERSVSAEMPPKGEIILVETIDAKALAIAKVVGSSAAMRVDTAFGIPAPGLKDRKKNAQFQRAVCAVAQPFSEADAVVIDNENG
jgi:hypothetical protein